MKYLVEHSIRRECYDIFDMKPSQKIKGQEKIRVMTFSQEEMDAIIDYVIARRNLDRFKDGY